VSDEQVRALSAQVETMRLALLEVLKVQRAMLRTEPLAAGTAADLAAGLLGGPNESWATVESTIPAGAPATPRPGDTVRIRDLESERLTIVGEDGRPRMVLSNPRLAPDPLVDGVAGQRSGGNPAGMVFYNDEGDECGGLTFWGERHGDGYTAGAALLFDQFKQDQAVGISHEEDRGQRVAGLHVWDRPDATLGTTSERGVKRLFVGKATDRSTVVELRDPEGRVRLRLKVDPEGEPGLEFFDASGQVTLRLP
jgi:hypothetical protein